MQKDALQMYKNVHFFKIILFLFQSLYRLPVMVLMKTVNYETSCFNNLNIK